MRKCQVAIIGGGPAGLTAAIECGKAGADTIMIDENARPGGQLFKQIHKFFGSREHYAGIRGVEIGRRLLEQVREANVEIWLESTVLGIFDGHRISVIRKINGKQKVTTIEAERILIATGGQENAINFDGWTLPGVMGAGCAQTMANVNLVIPGSRVLMIGSGNVGLMVSYQLIQAGAEVLGIVEAADHIGGYGVHAAKIKRAGVPFFLRHTVVKAEAGEDGTVARAFIGQVDERFNPILGTEQCIEADTICIAAGLRPITKLAAMSGAEMIFVPELGGWMPQHNEYMETSISGIYIAGDLAGVEEASTAMEEGRLAGVDIAYSLGMLTKEEAEQKHEMIRKRLEALRFGPFGERRLNAKKRIEAGGAK